MNLIHIAGHLGADAEVRYTSSGKKVTSLRIAARSRKGGKDETIWYRITIWGDQYDKMVPYLKKGTALIVAGELHKPEIFTDRDGNPQISMDVTATHIQFSPFGKSGASSEDGVTRGQHQTSPSSPFGSHQNQAEPSYASFPGAKETETHGQTFDDEVPF